MKLSKPLSALTLIALALLLNAAKSSALNPSPRPTPKPNESATFGDRQGEQQIAPIRTPAASQSPEQTGAPTKEQQNGSGASTVIIAVFTVVAGLATVAIAIFNYQLVGVTNEMKKATAEAAEAAEAALHIDRPFLLVTEVKFINLTFDGRADELLCIYEFEVCSRNFGVGPADIVDYIAGAAVHNISIQMQPIVEPQIQYASTGRRLNDSLVAPNEWAEGRIKEKAILTRADCDAVRNGEARIGIDGIIRYRGASKQVYWTRFFWWCFLDAADNPINIQRALRSDLNDHS